MADKEESGKNGQPLPADKAGIIQKVFRELILEDDCWTFLAVEAGTNCEIWEATCDSSEVDIYTGNFTTPQIHKYKKGGHIKICGSRVVLPKANRKE